MKNSKKSDVQLVKAFKLLSGEHSKTSSDLSAKIVDNYSFQRINLCQSQTKKFGLKIG